MQKIENQIIVSFDLAYKGAVNTPKPVILDKNGGTLGEKFPSDPVRSKYDFLGWYASGKKYTKDTFISESITLKARWISDSELMEGTAANPLLKGDFPDPSIIRVDNVFYMSSTTMYFMPVCPIMKSYDLVNWELVSYPSDIIEDLPNFRLETENADLIGDYGRGQWATSLRYFNSRYWVIFANNTTKKTYLFHTDDIEKGNWQRIVYSRQYHDPSLFFDEVNNKIYIVHGYNNITLTEMEQDLSREKPGGINRTLFPQSIFTAVGGSGTEGTHIFKANNYYYAFLITWISGVRSVLCCRAQSITAPLEEWELRRVLQKGLGSRSGGVAQGSIIDTPSGDWFGYFFQDRDAVGRVPVLVPMRWGEDMWPVFGDEKGNIPLEFPIMLIRKPKPNIYMSDDFGNNNLQLAWQWNHNPDNTNWSLGERPGYLRLKTGRVDRTIYHARNTLTQRTYEPACTAEIALEPVSMKDGDIAGLVVLQATSGFIGIEQDNGTQYVVMYTGDNEDTAKGQNAVVTRKAQVPFTGNRIYLKARCQFKTNTSNSETAVFSYSLDGETWQNIGTTVNLRYTLVHFTGARFGLFNYATKESGGYVDFDYYRIND